MKPNISIVVPTRGRNEKLAVLLKHLDEQSLGKDESFEVIVGLDGCPPPEQNRDEPRYSFALRYLPLERVGISAAKNAAVAQAGGELVILVNDDIEPEETFVHEHAAAHSAGQSVVLGASPWKRFGDQTLFDELIARTRMVFFYVDMADGGRYDFRHAWNLNLSVERQHLDGLSGPFCESLRPVFFDDLEFAFRLIGTEKRVYYHSKAVALHNHRMSIRHYFEREALLGVMADRLASENADCFQAVFKCDVDTLHERARRGLPLDEDDTRRCLQQFTITAETTWTNQVQDALLESLYSAHLPLKRRAFRCGLQAALQHPDKLWTERVAVATAALNADPVFAVQRIMPEIATTGPVLYRG